MGSDQVEGGGWLRRRLEADIISGRLEPGARLPGERQLAIKYGVSRPAVREVLSQLRATGLVAVLPARGTFVRGPSPDDVAEPLSRLIAAHGATVADVRSARQVLESACARFAVERAGDDQLAMLMDLALAVDEGTDRLAQARADLTFHLAIARMSANPVLYAMYRGIAPQVLGMMLRRENSPASPEALWVTHAAIAEAVAARDAARADRLSGDHLRSTERSFGNDAGLPVGEVARRDLAAVVGDLLSFDALVRTAMRTIDSEIAQIPPNPDAG